VGLGLLCKLRGWVGVGWGGRGGGKVWGKDVGLGRWGGDGARAALPACL